MGKGSEVVTEMFDEQGRLFLVEYEDNSSFEYGYYENGKLAYKKWYKSPGVLNIEYRYNFNGQLVYECRKGGYEAIIDPMGEILYEKYPTGDKFWRDSDGSTLDYGK